MVWWMRSVSLTRVSGREGVVDEVCLTDEGLR